MGRLSGVFVVFVMVIVLGTGCGTGADEADIVSLADDGRWDELYRTLEASAVDIPAGWTAMGTDMGRSEESPQRDVYLDRFAIDRYEVTNLQWSEYAAATGARVPVYWDAGVFPDGAALHPVVGVAWKEASAYCEWAGKRLPTEAEWERACRGTAGSAYPWGEAWHDDAANIVVYPLADPDEAWSALRDPAAAVSFPRLAPVGSHPRDVTEEGVCDMAGNAAEWLADWYDPAAYSRLPDVNPRGDAPPWNHSVRGSSWLFRFDDLVADYARCSFRHGSHSFDDPRVGFRCAADR